MLWQGIVEDPPKWLKCFHLASRDPSIPELNRAVKTSQGPSNESFSYTSQMSEVMVVSSLDRPPVDSKGPPLLRPKESGLYLSLLDLEAGEYPSPQMSQILHLHPLPLYRSPLAP